MPPSLARKAGSRILDVLLGGAKGFAAANNATSSEGGLAAGFGAGFGVGQERGVRRLVTESPEYEQMSGPERAYFEASPEKFLERRARPTVKVKARLFDPDADETEEIDLPVADATRMILGMRKSNTPRVSEGSQMLSEMATREVYRKAGKTDAEIAKLPGQITVRDSRVLLPNSNMMFFGDPGEDALGGESPPPAEKGPGLWERLTGKGRRAKKISKDEAAAVLDLVDGDKGKAELLAKALGLEF